MKTLKLLVAVISIMFSVTVNAQTKIVLKSTSDTLKIGWHHGWKDTTGAPENVKKFILYLSKNNGAFVRKDSVLDTKNIGRPDTTYTYRNLEKNCIYAVGVLAVDYAENKSNIHTSLQPTAHWGGWYIIRDNNSPMDPFGVEPK